MVVLFNCLTAVVESRSICSASLYKDNTNDKMCIILLYNINIVQGSPPTPLYFFGGGGGEVNDKTKSIG